MRPWKPPEIVTTPPAALARRESLTAASIDSAPELQKKTFPPSEDSVSRAASSMAGSV